MSGITPLKIQAVVIKGDDTRLVTLSKAQEIHEKNPDVSRWLNKKFLVHRHGSEHSLLRKDGTCENCPNGNCEPVRVSTLRVWTPIPRAPSKWIPRARNTGQETLALSAEMELFISERPDDLRREFEEIARPSPDGKLKLSFEGMQELLEIERSLPLWRTFKETVPSPDFEAANLRWSKKIWMQRITSWEPESQGPAGVAVAAREGLPELREVGTLEDVKRLAIATREAAQKPVAEESWLDERLRRLIAGERARKK